MNKVPGFGFIALWLSLLLLSGCMNDLAAQKQTDAALRQTDDNLLSSLKKLQKSEQALPLSNTMFRRQLALSFQKADQQVTAKQESLIRLFFQTLPADTAYQIIITVAPTSHSESFVALQQAWQRLRSLEQHLSEYGSKIELVYQPGLTPDTATLQVIGG